MSNIVQLIKQEIEKQIDYAEDDTRYTESYREGLIAAYQTIKAFIDNPIPEEQNKDLEEEMIRWHKEHFGNKRDWEKTSGEYLTRKSQLDIASHFAEWQKQRDQETIELAEDHAMLAGMNKMKEEMMENAVEAIVYQGLYSKYVKECDDEALANVLKNYNSGDKVKIIIVKED